MSRGMAWTIRSDILELWPGLVLHGMGEVDFHDFWKYWKLTSATKYLQIVPLASRLVLKFCWKPGHQIKPIICQKNDFFL